MNCFYHRDVVDLRHQSEKMRAAALGSGVVALTHVTAAIIRDKGRILICQRGAGGSCANLWEFPGGKLEPGETLEECIVRECREELAITLRLNGVYAETKYRYPEKEIILTFFESEIIGGTVTAKVHADTRWVTPRELMNYPFCPADEGVARRLSSEVPDSV